VNRRIARPDKRKLLTAWPNPGTTLASAGTSTRDSLLLRKFDSHSRDARLAHAERVGGDGRDIYDSAFGVRSAIDDRYDYVAAIVEILDSHARSKRQREMRGDQAAMIRIVIIGRNAELIRYRARKSEGRSERCKNELLQRRLLARGLPTMERFSGSAARLIARLIETPKVGVG
jgi:hypothetical protein